MRTINSLTYLIILSFSFSLFSSPGIPDNWGDFRIGLVNDNTPKINERMKQAVTEGVQLMYRYRYVNGGFDSTTNSMSWMFTPWTDYVKDSDSIAGVRPAFVIYMLQEEGGSNATIANAMDREKMRMYFANIKSVASRCNGYQSTFIIEPDTWGYLIQDGHMDPEAISANVTDLGPEFDYLQGLPNNLCGIAQGVIRTIHKYAPDAFAGCLASHWSVNSTGWNVDGLVWTENDFVDESADKNIAWFEKLLGNGPDRGDFIGVEKNGWSAGRWKVFDGRTNWYWGDEQMVKYLRWVKRLADGLALPVVGWQISIGHMGLPNITVETFTDNAYEDTFFPYFFEHVDDFLDAGFIGFLVGKGIADDTDFANETEGNVGDRGWFFSHLKEFDKDRPYLISTQAYKNALHPNNDFTATIGKNILTVTYPVPQKSSLHIDLFSLSGKKLTTLLQETAQISPVSVKLPYAELSTGIYLIHIIKDTFSKTVEYQVFK